MTSKPLHGNLKRGNYLAWNCNGEKLASGSQDTDVRVWTNVEKRNMSHQDSLALKGHTMNVNQVCWHPTNPDLLVSPSEDKSVRLWDTRTGSCAANLDGKYEGFTSTWHPDGNTIICGGKASDTMDVLLLIDARKPKIKKIVKFHYIVNEISFNKEGNHFYLTSGPGELEIWNWPEFKAIKSISAHTSPIYCINFSPNGKNFALGSADSLVSLWDVSDHVCLRTFGNLNGNIKSVSFSHDNQLLAAGSDDNYIDISHMESGEHIHSLNNEGPINNIAWHPTKLILAYTGRDKDRHDRETGAIKIFGNFQQFT